MTTELDAAALDAADPLAHLQRHFHQPEGVIYLDGNSLGLMPNATLDKVQEVTQQQWGQDLITSWNKHGWIDLPLNIGDRIGNLVGAAPGQTICCDSISVNLFKLLAAGLKLRPGRNKVLSTQDNFPTDLYMVQGLQALLGEQKCQLQLVEENKLLDSIDADTAVLMATEVNFRTGKRLDIGALTQAAHNSGALMLVDLAHSTGVMPVALDAWQVDFAVGCTYKYLNAGPGAPAFAYVARAHQHNLNQPLYGWMGHNNAFAFSPQYEPASDIKQLLVGTPPVISMSAVASALDVYDLTDISEIRQKSKQLTAFFQELVGQSQHCRVLRCISPSDPEQRGSQLCYEYEQGYGLCQALIARGVIADFRAPSYIRFGFAPLYNSFQQIADAVAIMEDILSKQTHLQPQFQVRNKVT